MPSFSQSSRGIFPLYIKQKPQQILSLRLFLAAKRFSVSHFSAIFMSLQINLVYLFFIARPSPSVNAPHNSNLLWKCQLNYILCFYIAMHSILDNANTFFIWTYNKIFFIRIFLHNVCLSLI